jgi:HJR/Mrr/RecB family endonuclease
MTPGLDIGKIFGDTFKILLQSQIGYLIILVVLGRFTWTVVKYYLQHKNKVDWFAGKQGIQSLRNLRPAEFEQYIAQLFKALGYSTQVVGGRGDGGIDVIVEKNGIKHYIQCKKFIM